MRIATHARRIATRITTARITTKMGWIRVAFAASVICLVLGLVLGLVLAQPLSAAPRSSPSGSQSPAPSASQTPALSGSQTSEARGECLSLPSRILARSIPYCVILPPGYAKEPNRRYPVLYYLHGLGDNEQMLLRSGGFDLVQELWDGHEIGDFIIVTPAGYASFFMNSRDGRFRYDDFFLQEFMPWIEKRYRTEAARESRGIGGISMGGYGALRMAFLHPQLFGSVSGVSAALMERLPSVSVTNSPESGRFRIFGNVFGSPPDGPFWERNNPVQIARTANLAGMKIHFDCGTQDDYGFDVGAQALHDRLAARHIDHEFHLYPGGHNGSYFAAHLPDALRFHAAAFRPAESRLPRGK